MDARQLPFLMMIVFLLVIIVGRVFFQFLITGNSGIRSGTKLKTEKEMCISFLMFGVVGIQLLITWLIAVSRLQPQIEFGLYGMFIGLVLSISGILCLIVLAPHILLLVTGILGFYLIDAYVKEIEEPYLEKLHGQKYQQYVSQTGSFFPRF